MKRIPELDSVRGIAILLVIGLHLFPARLPGAWIGVDIFLVLSGFLITSIFNEELQQFGQITLKRFYLRRVRRLYPALLCLLVFFILVPLDAAFMKYRAILAATFYFANMAYTLHWIPAGPLSHTWSLSLEEQFYLLWPLVLSHLRPQRDRLLRRIIAIAIVAIAIWRIIVAIFVSSPSWDLAFGTRADGLLIGCFVALFPLQFFQKAFPLIGPICGVIISLFAIGFFSDKSFQVVGLSVVTALTAATIAGMRSVAFLRLPLLVHLGHISYGLYLWHYPVTWFLEAWLLWPSRLIWIPVITLSVLFAELSYWLVERPLLHPRM